MMHGGRGFLSTNRSASNGDPPGNVATRARLTSAVTQLRQKPAAPVAKQQDFFASLGVDTTSRDRTSSNTSSNSYNGMTMGSASAPGVYSSTPTSSSSGWRPPPIVGLGSARATPPSPHVPTIGSLNVTSVHRSVKSTTSITSSTTTSLHGAGSSVASGTTGTTTAATTTGKSITRPTQLFSMEDAEDLYSDDGWNCDSPSTVLSNSIDETETTSSTEPGSAAVNTAAVKKTNDELVWGDNDDAFAGDDFLENKIEPAMHKAGDATELTTKSRFDDQVQSCGTSAPFDDAQPNSKASPHAVKMPISSSIGATRNAFDITSRGATQGSAFEYTQLKSSQSLPPVNLPSTSLPTNSTYDAFKSPHHEASRQPGSFVERRDSDEPYKHHNQWDEDWDEQEKPSVAGSTSDSTAIETTTYSSTTTAHQIKTLATLPVELTSPGGAAGEFWGDEEEDELFENDDNIEDEWDESVAAISSDRESDVNSSSHDTSISRPLQSPPHYSGTVFADQKPKQVSTVAQASNHLPFEHPKSVSNYSQDDTSQNLPEDPQIAATSSSELNRHTRAEVHEATMPMHSVGSSHLAKPETLRAECAPFSSAMDESASQDDDTNVFPEAPPSARYLHTPTGTGGPFGRVRSPERNPKFEDSPAAVHEATHDLMSLAREEKSETLDSYIQPSGNWDSGDQGPMSTGEQANDESDEPRHDTHNRQGDEKERDSVVSFSGENSFFPSAGRPSSLYGGSQSSFAGHRMYPSSIASTDHDGSSIASFGVSSAGATFGGSERVSEGGAFSDGTVSETPSMVDSSNASTTFGTDFPSVSEGQFSAPGTTIGGSDNASDGGFSDGNASEATSMCDSVNTNLRFVSEFSTSSGHYVTEEVGHVDMPKSYASFASDSAAAAAAPSFGDHDTLADANPFESSPMLFASSQHASGAPATTTTLADTCFSQSEDVVQEERIQSAASLFGTTTGADVPNLFDSNSASVAANEAKQRDEHELPTNTTGDLFGSSSFTSGFQSSFTQPTRTASPVYQTHNQTYNQGESGSQTSAINSLQSQFTATNARDRPPGGIQIPSTFDSTGSSNYDRVDPFASRNVQLDFDKSVPPAESLFNHGGRYNGHSSVDHGTSSQLDGDMQASTTTFFSRVNSVTSTASSHFDQQFSAHNAVHGGNQNFNHYAQNTTPTYADQASVGALNHEFQSLEDKIAHARAPTHFKEQSGGTEASASSRFANYSHQSFASTSTSNTAQHEIGGFEGQNHFGRSPDNHRQQSAFEVFASASHTSQPFGSQPIEQTSATPATPNNYNHPSTTAIGGVSPARSLYADHQGDRYAPLGKHTVPDPAGRFGNHSRSASSASSDAFLGRSSAAYPSSPAFDVGSGGMTTPSSVSPSQQPQVQPRAELSFASNASMHAEPQGAHLAVTSTVMRTSLQNSHDLDTSTGTVETANLSRQASSSSMSQYGADTSFQPEQTVHGYEKRVDANAFFGEAPPTEFSRTVSQDMQSSHPQVTDDKMHIVPQNVSLPCQEHEQHEEHSVTQSTSFESGGEYFETPNAAVSAPTVEPTPRAQVDLTAENTFVAPVENSISTAASEDDGNRRQTLPSIPISDPHALFGGATSSDFFSSPPAPQPAASMPSHFEPKQYIQETQEHQVSVAPKYFPRTDGLPEANSGRTFNSKAPRADNLSNESFSQQQQQQQQRQQRSYQVQQQYEHHANPAYGYRGGAEKSPIQGAGFNGADQYGNGVGYGSYGQTKRQQASQTTTVPLVKTSNKYKDPCAPPPSCLATFGFGGNVVTMVPTRKLRLNTAATNSHHSPRGSSVPYDFDHDSDAELRKGPVNVYRMDQLYPKDDDFEEMDMFPGPLTEDVTVETILDFLDHRLKRSETNPNADENERLLLGVLRVLVKCNGKLRSDPGTLNPSDPDSPEAQLIALLGESSTRRTEKQSLTFPAPQKIHSLTHPDVVAKHANNLRELLFVGDRKGAIATAMTAHMWPEAMLIASFTDKEEYRRVLRTYLDEHYVTGDPCRALFMSFADQQEKSVQEPKRLLQTNAQQPTGSLILSRWVSHAQILLSNRTADTNTILTELGDRLWGEVNAVAAAHVCYLLANVPVDAPTPTSKLALLGGDHRTPKEARFYVSPGAVQRTEIYEWAQKHANGTSGNLMIPFQGYKLIYAMLLADHGKLDTAFKYVTSMLRVIKAVMATMKPGTSMYLEGMKNQLTVLDDRLRQHLGQDRIASVAASTGRSGDRKQGGKWGLGSALSIMGKIVNRVVEGNDAATGASVDPNASSTPGGLYANEATASAPTPDYSTLATSSPAQLYPQQTPPPSSHEPLPGSTGFYGHATSTPPTAHTNALGYKRTSSTPPPVLPKVASFDNGQLASSGSFNQQQLQQQTSSGPFPGNGRPGTSGAMPNQWSEPQQSNASIRPQHPIEPPGSNRSTHSNHSFNGKSASHYSPQQQQQQQPPSSQTSQHSQGSSAFPKRETSSSPDLTAEMATSLRSNDAASTSGPASDKGRASPKFKSLKKLDRSKTPPPSSSNAKGSGWLSGLSSFIATKMNPEAKVAKLGEQMEAYFDEDAKRWVFPGETATEEAPTPSAPPTGPLPSSAPGSCATGVPPVGSNSAPGSISSGPAPSNDPLAALMAPPPSHLLMKKDPLAAMMAPPSRPGMYGARRGGSTAQRKPPRPQFAVFKPTAKPSE